MEAETVSQGISISGDVIHTYRGIRKSSPLGSTHYDLVDIRMRRVFGRLSLFYQNQVLQAVSLTSTCLPCFATG